MSPLVVLEQSSSPLATMSTAFGNDSGQSTVVFSENETEEHSTSVSSISTHDTSAMLLTASIGTDSGISSDSNNNLHSSPATQKNRAEAWDQPKDVGEAHSYGMEKHVLTTDNKESWVNADTDDLLMEKLDELLQSETSAEFTEDSGLCLGSVDNLFPTLSEAMEFPQLDPWSVDGDLEYPCPFQDETTPMELKVRHGDCVAEDMDEEGSVSQMFAQWLRSNSHAISLADLRKIKLKTSTIERATRRLGGGKRGLMLFVKFVLRWVQQNCHMKQDGETELPCDLSFLGPFAEESDLDHFSLDALSCSPSSPSMMMMMMMPQYDAYDFLPWSTQSAGYGWPPASSSLSPSREQNAANGFGQNGGCGHVGSLPFCLSDKTWIEQASALRGNASSSCASNLHFGGGYGHGNGDTASPTMTMMMHKQQQQSCDPANPARSTRAARKSRMERQRWSVRRSRKWSASSHHHHHQRSSSSAASAAAVGHDILASWSQLMASPSPDSKPIQQSSMDCDQQHKKNGRDLRLLFHKELKQSDVGNLGRIVLPKKAAESCLPPLELRNGMNLTMEDFDSPKVWNMRYRFWPNNKSRMYILENTGDFVKSYNLKEGDYMLLYFNLQSNRYMVRGAKGEEALYEGNAVAVPSVPEPASSSDNVGNENDEHNNLTLNPKEPWDDGLFVELIEQSLEDFRDSSDNEHLSDAMKTVK